MDTQMDTQTREFHEGLREVLYRNADKFDRDPNREERLARIKYIGALSNQRLRESRGVQIPSFL